MNDKPRRRLDLLEQMVGDELMLYDTSGRAVHVLNGAARYVWERCDGEHGVEEILGEAAAAFTADPQELRVDIEECMADFERLSLLEGELPTSYPTGETEIARVESSAPLCRQERCSPEGQRKPGGSIEPTRDGQRDRR